MKRVVLLWAVVSVAVLGAWLLSTQEPAPRVASPDSSASPLLEPGRVVARVNGRELREREVGINPEAPLVAPPFSVTADNFERLRSESAAPLVATAVDQALLEAEALRRGLDRDPEYLRRAAQVQLEREQERRRELASQEEQELQRATTAAATVTAAEADEYIASARAHPDPFGMDKHITPESVSAMLRIRKGDAAYQRQLRGMILEADVHVGGTRVSEGRLAEALSYYFPALAADAPTDPAAFSAVGLHRLMLEALRDGGDELGGSPFEDVDRLSAAFTGLVMKVRGRALPLGRTPCVGAFDPHPTATETGVRSVDPHALSFCLYNVLRVELLVQSAEEAGRDLPMERQEARRLQIQHMLRSALIAVLLRQAGVLDAPEGIPEAQRRLVERLRAEAQVELLY